MSVFLAPTFGVGYQGMTLNGALLSGGQIYTYQAGSSTLQPTYTTSAGTIQNTNPIILDASGKPPAEVWLTQGQAYKFVVMDSLSNVIATYDNVSGINDVTSTSPFSEWVATGLTPTYVSTTQFTVPGNQTTVLQVNRRVQITCTAGVIYGYISASVYTSLTTVTVVMDSTPLDSGISIVNVALLNAANPSVPYSALVLNSTNSTNATNSTNVVGIGNAAAFDARYAALAGLSTQAFSAADGASGKQVINISQFVSTLAAQGSVTLPGGIIIKAGQNTVGGGGSVAVTFTNAFPTACIAVTATTIINNNNTAPMACYGITTTGFTMYGPATLPGSWIAIGY